MSQPSPLELKQRQFSAAMERYERAPVYRIGKAVSVANVSLQLLLVALVWRTSIGSVRQLVAFVAVYVLADFVNGLVHVYMDGNDAYESPLGGYKGTTDRHCAAYSGAGTANR